MRSLSIKQPWAALIAAGRKTIEVRTWTTKHRGDMVICASKKPDDAPGISMEASPDWGFGVTLALVELVTVRPLVREDHSDAFLSQPWSSRYEGCFAWVLANPRRLEHQHVRGLQGLFTIDDSSVIERTST
jgi:hypothetical protein